jgi:hypothetical protein
VDAAERQLELLREPSHYPQLARPCTVGDGIQEIAEIHHADLMSLHRQAAEQGRWSKFVPASGAASRMVAFEREDEVARLAEHLERFAFYPSLELVARRNGRDLAQLRSGADRRALLELLLSDSGLSYNDLPKALIEFHRDGESSRTAFEEHLREAARCFVDHRRVSRAHFTVSSEQQSRFESMLAQLTPRIRDELNAALEVGFSPQKPSTDYLALDQDDEPVRNGDGALLFRPGGHGVLLENLEDLGGDLVFVKNVDNVCHPRWQATAEHWIQVLGGYLIQLQAGSHRGSASAEDRPLRVCGVVRNEGEPGGGPFWVREADGSCSLQIVEGAEVAPDDRDQQRIFSGATHFNPVFMALGLRDRHNRPFPLQHYVSGERFLLTWKTAEGRRVRVLERPGLWNGSMAGWNTVFVEVPKQVFAPVKTVFDLLRDEHQP